MDLEKLNKSQIILLTLLTSFVTSIATGIVTVSLMEQAPPAITQTVNRIVERTVEKVVPSSQPAAVSTVIEKPVLVRESDLIAKAVERISPSLVRLYTPSKDADGKDMQLFVGLALVTGAEGQLVADAGTPDGPLTALRHDGAEVTVSVVARPAGSNMIRLQAATTSTQNNDKLSWNPAPLSDKKISVGTTVVAIGGRSTTRIAQGIVTGLSEEKEKEGMIVDTDIASDVITAGSPLLDADGAIIAIATRESRTEAPGGFLASWAIILDNAKAEEESKPPSP